MEHPDTDRNAVLESALRECADKLWVLRCNSRDADDRQAAERAYDMVTAALTTTPEPTDPAGVSEMANEIDRECAQAEALGYTSMTYPPRYMRQVAAALRTPDPVLEVAKDINSLTERLRQAIVDEANRQPATWEWYDLARAAAQCIAALQTINGRKP